MGISLILMKVLLITEEEGVARLIKEYLTETKDSGFTLIWARSLSEGIKTRDKEKIDILIIDLNLPDSNCQNTVQKIQDSDFTIPVIILAGYEEEQYAINAMHRGAEQYILKKDLTRAFLVTALRNGIECHKIRLELKEKIQEFENIINNFRNLIAMQTDGIIVVDERGLISYMNHVAMEILDFQFDALVDTPFTYGVKEDRVLDIEILRKKKPSCIVEMYQRSFLWGGKWARFISIRDVTDQKKAEDSLRRNQDILLEAQNIAHFGSWEHDIKTGKETWSDEIFRIFGQHTETGKASLGEWQRNIHPQDWIKLDAAIQEAIRNWTPFNLEIRITRPDGTVRWGWIIGKTGSDEYRNVIKIYGTLQDITERRQAQESLQQSEESYRSLVEQLNDVIYTSDTKGRITFISPAVEALTGIKPFRMLNHNLIDFIVAEDRPVAATNFQKLLAGEFVVGEYRILNKKGDLRWIRVNTRPFFKKKILFGTQGIVTDITDQKEIEQELKFRNLLLSTQQETSLDGILVIDENREIISFNQRFVEMWKIPLDVINKRSNKQAIEAILQNISNPNQFLSRLDYLYSHSRETSQDEIILKDGRIFERYSSPLLGSTGQFFGRIWYFRDITERRRAEEALRDSEQKFRSFLEQSAEAFVLTDELGKITLWNRSAEQIFGLAGLTVLGKNLWDVQFAFVNNKQQNSQYYEAHKKNVLEALKTGEADWMNKVMETEIRLTMGKNIVIETIAFPIKSEKGFLLGFINRDVTEHKRSEELLYRRLAYERMLTEISTQALIIPEIDHFIQKSLQTLGKSLEITRVSLYNNQKKSNIVILLKEWIDASFPSPEKHLKDFSQKSAQWIAEEMAHNQVKLYVDPEQDVIKFIPMTDRLPYEKTMLIVPLFVNDEYFGFLGFEDARHDRVWKGEDIDILRTTATIIAQTISRNKYKEELEQLVVNRTKQLQKTLEQSEQIIRERQKVEEELLEAKIAAETANRAKSEFLANMSHELRTPLNAITGFSQIVQDGVAGVVNLEQKEILGNILESGNHLLALINEILDLSKIEAGKVELRVTSFPLKPFLERCKYMFSEKAAVKNIGLSLDIANNIDIIVADEVKLKQVVFNLLSNAVKYTLTGGDAGIIAKPVGSFIQITVWDTGIGIAPQNLPKLFQPFGRIESEYSKGFSGTGLGLHYSKKLVELHGGRIWVVSEEGRGSQFHFTIPLSNPKPINPIAN